VQAKREEVQAKRVEVQAKRVEVQAEREEVQTKQRKTESPVLPACKLECIDDKNGLITGDTYKNQQVSLHFCYRNVLIP
jgi:hypothetical protein